VQKRRQLKYEKTVTTILKNAGIASGSVMEDQWQALRWLINQTVSLGYTIKAGQLLMTGLIGGIHPARPGAHLADFGAAGCIAFEIVD
jgi:2-keto-4-pentenoate hydratase